MDIADSTTGPIIRDVPGIGQVSFNRISVRQLGLWAAEFKAKRRTQAILDADDAKLEPFAKYRAIQEATNYSVSTGALSDYLIDPENIERVFIFSLGGDKAMAAKFMEASSRYEVETLVIRLMGVGIYYEKLLSLGRPPQAAPVSPQPAKGQETGGFGDSPLPSDPNGPTTAQTGGFGS